MPLRTDMPTRADARPGTADDQHTPMDYNPDAGGWYPAEPEPAPAATAVGTRG